MCVLICFRLRFAFGYLVGENDIVTGQTFADCSAGKSNEHMSTRVYALVCRTSFHSTMEGNVTKHIGLQTSMYHVKEQHVASRDMFMAFNVSSFGPGPGFLTMFLHTFGCFYVVFYDTHLWDVPCPSPIVPSLRQTVVTSCWGPTIDQFFQANGGVSRGWP